MTRGWVAWKDGDLAIPVRVIAILRPEFGNSMLTSCPSHATNRMLIHLQLCSALPNRSFPAFGDLIRQVKQSAANESDMSRLLGAIIKEMADEAVDPYLMAGLLIEDAVHTVVQRIPLERQRDTTRVLVHLLINRLMARSRRSDDKWG
jgi:hypothetical protein